ncbi:MAG: hypothetical protein KDA21_13685, partial [Phycisphaerales bacterium]|nr:hypothetical protein [Phycisphaerales bacterium]
MSSSQVEMSDKTFDSVIPDLRVRLLNAQFDQRSTPAPAIILLGGEWRRACEAAVDRLHEWLDARYLKTVFFGEPTREQRARPRFWRYWMALPGRGELALFFGGWPVTALAERLDGTLDDAAFEARLARIRGFEETLVADGTRLIKIWIRSRCNGNGDERPRVENIGAVSDWPSEWKGTHAREHIDTLLSRTTCEAAPWHMIDAPGWKAREVAIGRVILEGLERRSLAMRGSAAVSAPAPEGTRLASVDLSRSLDHETYARKLEKQQKKITRLSRRAWDARRTTVIVLEGWDAAGKGGAIRRLARAVPLRNIAIVPISAPSELERAHHYLWRF